MRFSTRIAKIIFIVTALVLLIIATILFIQVSDLVDANKGVNHITEVKLHLAQTLSSSKDAETAQRGYLLTKDSLFLQPYLMAIEGANTSIQRLNELTKDNKEQQQNLEKLKSLVNLKFSSFNYVIDSFFEERSELQKRQILLRDKSLVDSIRRQTNKMENVEMRLMDKTQWAQMKNAFFAPVATVSLVFLSLAVLAFSYYRITLDLKASERHVQEMKSLNAELLEKNRQLEITNEELDSFNYISSHDLQEPVRKIRTFISMIEETELDKLSEKNKYNFNRIQAASIRIQELLQDLLSYSQIKRKPVDFVEVDLNQIIEGVTKKMAADIEKNKATIRYQHLPSIKGVPFQMEQLFEQLLSNALKYKRNGIAPHITIHYILAPGENIGDDKTFVANAYHKISFEDNGIGFEEGQEQKVFELFTQLHNKEYGGTGIGLTICRKIVQNHNGFIKARGQVNEGAIFEIYLPVN